MQWLKESRQTERNFLILFHGPDMKELATQIASAQPEFIELGEIAWDKFEDGFPNLFIKNVKSIHGRHVAFLASFLNHSELLSQLSVIYTIPRYLAKSLIILLPYFPTGTMERVDEEGQIATATTFARLLSNIPFCTPGGPAKLIVYDIHALQNRFYFSDNVVPLLVSAVPLFQNALQVYHKDENVVIAFPDEGAGKRFGNFFKHYNVVICTKVREGNKRVITVKEGAELVKKAHVFIVDDLVKTGGTLIQCKNALFTLGAAKVSAYVTHAVFPQESWKKFIEKTPDQFSIFYTTDSCPETIHIIRDKAPFHILTLTDSIVSNILKY